MSKVKKINANQLLCKRMTILAGLFLLFVFTGRVALVSIYGYAGIQKSQVNLTSNSTEQGEDNSDSKEESQYAQKQFKCFSSFHILELMPVINIAENLTFALLIPHTFTACYLSVSTPPPNC